MSEAKVTLWRINHVPGVMGVWDQAWFATEEEARLVFEDMLSTGRYQLADEEDGGPDGSQGDIEEPESVDVDVTPEGLLEFARHYACDQAN
jgi:hypothetical protein